MVEMLDIDKWTRDLLELLLDSFKGRLLYLGLQGSQRRGEAHKDSDIDIVVILDKLNMADINLYKRTLKRMPDSDRACGFICGSEDLLNWPESDLFILAHDTKDIFGHLSKLLPLIKPEMSIEAARKGVSDLLHILIHSWLYGSQQEKEIAFRGAAKQTLFICFILEYLHSGVYYPDSVSLRANVSESMGGILSLGESSIDLETKYDILIGWLQSQLASLKKSCQSEID